MSEPTESKDLIPLHVAVLREMLFKQIHAALETFTAQTGLMVRDVSWSIHRAYADEVYANYDPPQMMRAIIETK